MLSEIDWNWVGLTLLLLAILALCFLLFRQKRKTARLAERMIRTDVLLNQISFGDMPTREQAIKAWDSEKDGVIVLFTAILSIIDHGTVRISETLRDGFFEAGNNYFHLYDDLATSDYVVEDEELARRREAVEYSIRQFQSRLGELSSLGEDEQILALACQRLIGELGNVVPIRR